MMATKNHKKVAVIERHFEVGGGCTHWGTIPSKALRHAVKVFHDLRTSSLLKDATADVALTFPQLIRAADGVIDKQVAQRRRYYERNKVRLYEGAARFVDPHQLEVVTAASTPAQLRADHVVIAAGSRP